MIILFISWEKHAGRITHTKFMKLLKYSVNEFQIIASAGK